MDSTGATIEFLLSAKRDAATARRFLQKALRSPGHPRLRVINVDRNPSYPKPTPELKRSGELGLALSMSARAVPEQHRQADHRAIKRRVRASQGFRALHCAWRTPQGIETMNMIRKGTSQMATKERHRRAGRFRRTTVWAHDRVIAGATASSCRSRSLCRCNTARQMAGVLRRSVTRSVLAVIQ